MLPSQVYALEPPDPAGGRKKEGLPTAGLVIGCPRGGGEIDLHAKTGPLGGRGGAGLLTRTGLPQGPSLPRVLLPFWQVSFSYTQAHEMKSRA